jgi:hypothetical protein
MSSPVETRVAVNEANIKRLETCVFGNGQPGLEAKLMGAIGIVEGRLTAHIEKVDRHTTGNMQDGDGMLLDELREEKRQRETQYDENNRAREKDKAEIKVEQEKQAKSINRLTVVMGSLNGALLIIKGLEDMGLIHMGTR